MTSRQRQQGYLLITAVTGLFLLATVAVLLSLGSSIGINSSNNELENTRARYLSEAAIQHALWQTQNSACTGNLSVPITALGADRYEAIFTGAAAGSLYALSVDQDAWIRNDDPDKNNGTSDRNHIRYEGGKTELVLTRFDLAAIPAGAQVNSAIAWFHVASGKEHPEGPITAHEILADWAESTVTWESFGKAYRGGSVGTIPAQDTGDVWVSFNVTGLVQGWVNGQPNHGILFQSKAEGVHAEYTGRENGANPPRLDVVVGSGTASPVTITAKGTLENGVERKLAYDLATVYQPASHHVLQHGGSAGKDAFLTEFKPGWNYGGYEALRIRSPGSDWNSALQFDLASVPRHARIVSATLELYKLNSSNNAAGMVNVHAINRSWEEGDSNGCSCPGVTFDDRDSGLSWNSPGGDFDAVPTASIAVDTATDRWVSWDVTGLVQDWADGTRPNYGMMLTPGDATATSEFASSDYSDPTLHPKLSIRYACECGTPCMVPSGAGRIALIGDDNSPDYDDQLKISLFESWGYEVDFFEDRDSDMISWSNYDLAYVSETSVASDVRANLVDAPIGVVNEEPNLYDDLGLADGDTERVGSIIAIIDNSHFITAIFQQGPLSIYAGDMEILTADAPLADGLQVLGEFGGSATLTVLDKGAQRIGGTAAGRRVTLPFGQHFAADFDWANLNGTGELLVQRAIAWAAGSDIVSSGSVLMVVGNDGNLTAQEQLKKTLLESWGFAVNVIDEDDSQADFDAAVASNEVVFITEDVNAGDVNTKLTDATIGIVTEEANLADDFGFADSIQWGSGLKLTVDNSFYITSTFGTGTIGFSSAMVSVAGLTGDIAPGAQYLGYSDAGPSLIKLETGAELVGAGTAAGRRVLLPWGGNDMDVGLLNDNGLMLFQRAIEWAAGANLAGPIAHWKLDETTGTTAIDSAGGHDGSLANGPAWASGVFDGALDFDGANDYVDLTTDAELTDIFDGGATVTGWIYPRSWGESDNGRILDKASQISGDRDGWMIAVRGATPAVQFAQGFTGTRGFWRSEAGTVSLNEWTHFAVVYDASSVDNDAEIYLNGVKQSPLVEITPTGTLATDAGIALRMGNYAQDTSRTFDGVIDDVRIYDRLLSSGEIAALATLPPKTPLAHWRLDETGGFIATDSVGGRDGTLINGPTWAAGQLDNAVRFDGSNDRINVPHDAGLNIESQITLSAWIYPDTLKPFQIVLTKGDGGVAENYWLGTEGNKANFGFVDGGAYAQHTTSGLTLQAGQWHHIAATFDDAANEVKIYVDGVAETFTNTYAPAANNEQLIIGNSYYAGEGFDGLIDDVRLYDFVLGATEIASLAAEGGSGNGSGNGCNGTYRDDFNSVSWSGSDGTLAWNDPWAEVGESDGAGSGDVRIQNDVSNYQLRIRDNDNGGEGVERVADLTGAGTATLSFDYRRRGLDSSGDYVAVYASSNGTAGPWTELPGPRIQGGTNDSSYQPWTRDISAFISGNTAIRLRSSSSMGGTDTVYFDNVRIQCAP
ncbi:MAG: DNRLRE domain-containing protein [Woeseiaceae bacterium]|nr:DNRLRE domain-containing protein [Woeseiaceae bacterium]